MLNRRLIPLGLVTALAASTPALATNDLDSTVNVPTRIESGALNVTASTLRSAAQTNPGRYAHIGAVAGNNLDTISKAGIGYANAQVSYWRLDLTNAIFVQPVLPAELTFNGAGGAGDIADTITQGGALGDNFVIFNYTVAAASFTGTGTTGFTQNVNVVHAKATNAAAFGVLGTAPVTATITSYTDVGNATNKLNPLSTKSGTIMNFASSLKLTSTPLNAQSNVSSLFTAFNAAGTTLTASLGTVALGLNAALPTVNPTTLVATAATLASMGPSAATALTTITGDFSFGTWSLQQTIACNAAVAAQTRLATLIAADKLSATLGTLTIMPAGGGTNRTALCVTTTAAEVVPATSAYTVSAALGPLAAVSMIAPGAQAGSFGRITRNGSTVQVPYLTTFADYNQRLTLVNRGTTDVTYSVAFTPETGTTAVAGTAATGTVAAGTSLVVKAVDLVTLTGKSRTAATVTIVSATGTLDVSTNQVAADGSTDTIVYAKNVL